MTLADDEVPSLPKVEGTPLDKQVDEALNLQSPLCTEDGFMALLLDDETIESHTSKILKYSLYCCIKKFNFFFAKLDEALELN